MTFWEQFVFIVNKIARTKQVKSCYGQILEIYFNIVYFYKKFTFRNKKYSYFYHSYNITFFDERTVEIPIFAELVSSYKNKRILEVGNVLSNYFKVDYDIVDKYDQAPGVINQDVVTYKTNKKYELIISISTLEHVGWDEVPRKPQKIFAAMKNLKNLLTPHGFLIASIPLGYNSYLDTLLKKEKIGFNKQY